MNAPIRLIHTMLRCVLKLIKDRNLESMKRSSTVYTISLYRESEHKSCFQTPVHGTCSMLIITMSIFSNLVSIYVSSCFLSRIPQTSQIGKTYAIVEGDNICVLQPESSYP